MERQFHFSEGQKELLVADIKAYLRENIEDYAERCKIADNYICKYRCDLNFADPNLASEIDEYLLQFIYDELLEIYNENLMDY